MQIQLLEIFNFFKNYNMFPCFLLELNYFVVHIEYVLQKYKCDLGMILGFVFDFRALSWALMGLIAPAIMGVKFRWIRAEI